MMRKLLPILLISFGAAAIVIAFGADLLKLGGDPGMGTKQILLAVVGLLSLIIGLIQRYNLDWHQLFAGPSVSSAQLLRMGICLGLLAGLLESVLLLSRIGLGIIINLNLHLLWMKPLANLILFIMIGLILLPFSRRWPDICSLRFTGFVLVFLASLALLTQFPQLHTWAKVLLAAGLAVQASRFMTGKPDKLHTLIRGTTPWVAGLAVLVCVSFYAWKTLPERQALSELPPAKPDSPNVLLLVLDAVRAQSLSLYGYHRQTTPRLEEFAKTGVCFERALSTSPWTLPSHATMFTGRFTHQLFGDGQTPLDAKTPLGNKYKTLAEYLSENGYVTGGFIGNVGYCGSSYGLNRGFTRYEDHVPSFELFSRSSGLTAKMFKYFKNNQNTIARKSAADINQSFLNWRSGHKDRPFFAFLNYFDAHDPYIAPQPFELKFGTQKPKLPTIVHDRKYKAREIRQLLDAYDSCIAYLDNEIGLLLDELKEQDVLKNTVVIVTSDHGEQFGEHGLMYHVNSLYRQLLQVPLLISFPNSIPAGKRFNNAVSLRDLPATIIDLVNLENPNQFPGSSLARYWSPEKKTANGNVPVLFAEIFIGGEEPDWIPESWPVAKGEMKSVVAGGYHYIQHGDGNEELFDFDNDPEEERDLANSKEYAGMLKQMGLSVAAGIVQNYLKID
ncbi:MAG: DUF229 domain-containing protein [Caldithrix sp.]|nr:MAG: DUF229 domain-containing protein [Caldithrix sp.]